MGNVLFVDDNDMVIQAVPNLLAKMGHNVLTAKSGEAAIDIYSQHGSEIDLVLLELAIPLIGGGETHIRLKEINPGIRTVLTSWHSMDSRAMKLINHSCQGFLHKPFRESELVKMLKEI